MDNISLEISVHWLSEEIVRFEIEVGFIRNLQECNSGFDILTSQAASFTATNSIYGTVVCGQDL